MSIEDARDLSDGERITADICIIGGGPAGISLALELEESGIDVVLLEGGDVEFDPEVQSLYAGESLGDPYRPLEETRLRMLGGSSNHWEGFCRPLDRADLSMDGVRLGGEWPLSYEELDEPYVRAQELCQLPRFEYSADDWGNEFDVSLIDSAGGGLRNSLIHQGPPTRFGEVYEEQLRDSEQVLVYLHANVIELAADQDDRVEEAIVGHFDGKTQRIRATYYVLAAGGIENPRLLMTSDRGRPGGWGNQHDLVGRFFAEHPHLGSVHAFVPSDRDLTFYTEGRAIGDARVRGMVTVDEDLRVGHGIGNFAAFVIDPTAPVEAGLHTDAARMVAGLSGGGGPGLVRLQLMAEQEMRAENRVELDSVRDSLGMRRSRLRWSLGDRDWHTLRMGTELLASHLGIAGFGPTHSLMHGGAEPSVFGGSHHMGTTRMHEDPRYGVVDPQGRVHGTENLYVAGSSVFPSVGFANPTLTLVALAVRLAGHLAEVG